MSIRTAVARVLGILIATTMTSCASTPIARTRIESALETTFANLARLQLSRMALGPAIGPFAVHASCRTLVEGVNSGSGDWVCAIMWQGPDQQSFMNTYDLFVTTEGCYTATAEGAIIGGPTATTRAGRPIKNLLFTFEGCFDTT